MVRRSRARSPGCRPARSRAGARAGARARCPAARARRAWWRRCLAARRRRAACSLKFGKVALLAARRRSKVLTTSASMLVSIAAYSLIWGWKFAVGFVLLLLVHEMGHVIQLRREGIPASAPMFIPFLGAVVTAKSLGDDATAEARVGLAGPVLGTLGAIALFLAGDPPDSTSCARSCSPGSS